MKLRAKCTQRESYNPDGILDSRIEFELSRLIEKELHYHQKVEDEKMTLERQGDFNMVACFRAVDPRKLGFIDFDQLFNFMKKFNQNLQTSDVNAILRRLNDNEDFKIDFREFVKNLSPQIAGYRADAD